MSESRASESRASQSKATESEATESNTTGKRAVRRALISVYDKAGLEVLAQGLHEAGVALVSTGSTASRIAEAGVPVTRVENLTGFPECLDGRVKTLHPKVHAGILADTRNPDHVKQLADLGVEPFDLVVSNLYPFTETVGSSASQEECVEQIDIGGPAMVRGAAKNHASVAIVTNPGDYGSVLVAVRGGGFTLEQRKTLAAEAFAHTATYDVAVASWMASHLTDTSGGTGFPEWVGATWNRKAGLRYGENPHQKAALYASGRPGIATAEQLNGKEMSYNNFIDADAAQRAAFDHAEPAVAVVKHTNPCGIAVGVDVAQAHRRAHACDPMSAWGGVVATNRTVTAAMAEQVAEVFTEVVVAPDYEPEALEILKRKKAIRLLRLPDGMGRAAAGVEFRAVSGGLLMQSRDKVDAVVDGPGGAAATDAGSAADAAKGGATGGDDPTLWTLVCGEPADAALMADLSFAWRAVRAVKSNAILLAKDGASVGIGMGQVNRVDSCHLAVTRAGAERAAGSAAASDAFFPFADGLQVLLDAGVRAVVAPGGSKRDPEVIAAAEAAGATMYFTGTRHFAH